MRTQLLTLDHLVQLMDPQLYLHLQSADSTNFFFFFRMLLVWYKREFEWPDVLRLWETLWTDYLSSSFHLFVAVGILEKHRDVIMDHLKQFDEVLKYSASLFFFFPSPFLLFRWDRGANAMTVNELSNSMELIPILTRAESIFRRFERTVQNIDKKKSFPAPLTQRIKGKAPTRPGASSGSSGSSSGVDGASPDDPRVISPELWTLLRRDIPWARDRQEKEKEAERQT